MQKILIFLFFLVIFGYTIFSVIKIGTTFTPDFSIFYHAALDILHHASPYTDKHLFTVFNYPLVTAVFFIPFALVSFTLAQTLFTLLNVFLIFGICYLCFLLMNKKFSLEVYLLSISFTLLAFPTKFTFGMGQVNLFAYFFLLLGLLFYQKEKFFQTLFFLVLSIFFKPILGFVLLVFFFEKQWIYFFATSFIFLFLCLITPLLLHQPQASNLFIHALTNQSLAGREVYYNQGLLGFISRLTNNLHIRLYANILVTIFLSIITFLKLRSVIFLEKISLLLTFLVIIDPLSWQHHFVFLILPFFIMLDILKIKRKKTSFLFLGLSYVLVASNIKQPQLFSHFPATLVLNNQFYAGVILFALEIFFFTKLSKILYVSISKR